MHYTIMTKSKIVMIGNTGVGKSSLLQRLVKGCFVSDIGNTIGMDTVIQRLKKDDKEHLMVIWDTAGQERYESITTAYYRDADAALIVFDLSNRQSFTSITKWHELLLTRSWNKVPVIVYLIGNKSDSTKVVVSQQEINDLVSKLSIQVYISTSAMTGENVNSMFNALFDRLITVKTQNDPETFHNIDLSDPKPSETKAKNCCGGPRHP